MTGKEIKKYDFSEYWITKSGIFGNPEANKKYFFYSTHYLSTQILFNLKNIKLSLT